MFFAPSMVDLLNPWLLHEMELPKSWILSHWGFSRGLPGSSTIWLHKHSAVVHCPAICWVPGHFTTH